MGIKLPFDVFVLLNNWGEVNLFTRPRRFSKSLNMSMLKYFFSYGCDPKLFDGLSISGEKELCERYMGKYSEDPDLEAACRYALKQIEEKHYADRLIDDGMTNVLKYGIACRKNGCMVRMSGI